MLRSRSVANGTVIKFPFLNEYILNMAIAWISWGAAPGYIKIAPKGLFKVIFVF
jgi:hypothetical protein